MKTTTRKPRKQKTFDGVVVFTVNTCGFGIESAAKVIEAKKTFHDFTNWPDNYDRLWVSANDGTPNNLGSVNVYIYKF